MEDPTAAAKLSVSYRQIVDVCNLQLQQPLSADAPALLLLRAQAYIGLREHMLAVMDARRAIAQDESVYAAYVLGRAAIGAEDYETAKQAITLLENKPRSDREVKIRSAVVALASDGDPDRSLALLNEVADQDSSGFALALRANAKYSLRDYAGALKDIESYLSTHARGPLGNPSSLHTLKAKICEKLGLSDDARTAMADAAKLSPQLTTAELRTKYSRTVRGKRQR